jgi:hypothetical protein
MKTFSFCFENTGVDFHVFDTSGIVGCDVTIVDPTCPSDLGKAESVLFRKLSRLRLGSMCYYGSISYVNVW